MVILVANVGRLTISPTTASAEMVVDLVRTVNEVLVKVPVNIGDAFGANTEIWVPTDDIWLCRLVVATFKNVSWGPNAVIWSCTLEVAPDKYAKLAAGIEFILVANVSVFAVNVSAVLALPPDDNVPPAKSFCADICYIVARYLIRA